MGSKFNRFLKLLPTYLRVWTYVRVSTRKQVRREKEEFGSLEKQNAGIEFFVKTRSAEKWKVENPVSDPAEAGDKLDRDGLQKILNGARKREFDILVIYNYDRLSRNWAQAQKIIDELESCGVTIWVAAVNTKITLRTPEGLMQASFAFLQAEAELLRIRNRHDTDARQTAGAGVWQGGRVPMGFRGKKIGKSRVLEINKRYAKYILELFTRLAAVESPGEIIKDFTRRKILTPPRKEKRKGRWKQVGRRPFTWDLILKIVRNPLYAGLTYVRNPDESQIDESKIVGRLADGTVYFAGKHPGIVSLAIWQKAMKAVEDRPRVQRKPRETDVEGRFLLQGLLYCSCCGLKMTPKGHGDRPGHYVAISVAQRNRYPSYECKVCRIPAPIIEDSVLTLFQHVIEKPDVIEAACRHGSTRSDLQKTKNSEEIAAALKKSAAQCDRLTACIAEAKTTIAATALVPKLEDAIKTRDQLHRALNAMLAESPANLGSTKGIRSIIASFAELGAELNRRKMKELFRLWILKCVVSVVKDCPRARVIRVELQVKQDQNDNHKLCAPLRIEFEHYRKRQAYTITKPFVAERQPSSKLAANGGKEGPLDLYEKYDSLGQSMKQLAIAAKVGKTPAHVCQILSLGKIEPALRKQIRLAPPERQHHFTLNKLLALKSLSPTLQDIRVRKALAA